MWFDDDSAMGRKGRFWRKNVSRRRPVLMVNARLKRRQEWPRKAGILVFLVAALCGTAALGVLCVRRFEGVLFLDNDEYLLKNRVIAVADSNGDDNPDLKEHVARTLEHFPAHVGTNLYRIDIALLQAKLGETHRVKSVRVWRQLPDALCVEVTGRSPVASLGHWRDRGLVVDAEGVVFFEKSKSKCDLLPTVSGYPGKKRLGENIIADIDDALAILEEYNSQRISEQQARIARLQLKKERVDVILDNDVVASIRWFADAEDADAEYGDLSGRLSYLYAVMKTYEAAGVRLRTVNLTLRDFKNNCATTPLLPRRN
jgi:hypothetical protein